VTIVARQAEEHGSYVRQVAEEARRHTRRLLEENAALRQAVAVLGAAEDQRRQAVEAAEAERHTVRELREGLGRAEVEKAELNKELAAARQALATQRAEREQLVARLRAVDDESRQRGEQFVMLEQQTNNLANLYVAAYRLHETLDRSTVIQVIQEILANLVGCEEMALFETAPDGETLTLAASNQIDPAPYGTIRVGAGAIGRAVATGTIYLSDDAGAGREDGEEGRLTACIPLRLGERVVGAIALFRLLPQKPALGDLDREIFDLMASQAAMALYCTSLHERQHHNQGAPRGD
jgi:hypothetical protein